MWFARRKKNDFLRGAHVVTSTAMSSGSVRLRIGGRHALVARGLCSAIKSGAQSLSGLEPESDSKMDQ
ncbi:unnamed protein product [Soboliphyme baturini]|uniref:Ald_Xan_dh_C2 domain-containing protein n=1 Tax=Soboliphyme baturini TaxID=241478 RepID=A0A183IEY7_9BILA|nr:unnamed protein product [Soboliphyme baturini]